MTYIIGREEFGVLIELLSQHRGTLTQDQLRRLSHDPDDLVQDLLGATVVTVTVVLKDA